MGKLLPDDEAIGWNAPPPLPEDKELPVDTHSTPLPGGTWNLGDLTVTRFGYGAMQLAGPWVMGPPADHDGALAVLRGAVELGITHRHQRRLRAAHHQRVDPRGAAPLARFTAHRDQGGREP